MIRKVSGRSKKCPDHLENVAGLSKILQNHLKYAFVADLNFDAIYALYPESFCDKKLAIWKVFAFCDSDKEDNMNSNTLLELLEEVEPGSADMGAGLAKVTL